MNVWAMVLIEDLKIPNIGHNPPRKTLTTRGLLGLAVGVCSRHFSRLTNDDGPAVFGSKKSSPY